MNETPFYMTRTGRRFYEQTVPELTRQIERLAEVSERSASRLDQSGADAN